jgi:hypothetical protein
VTATSTAYPDLFFALRGAAPSYGIVTSWSYQTVAAPPTLVTFTIDFPSSVYKSHTALTSVLTVFDTFNRGVRDEMWMDIALASNGDGGGNDSGGTSGVYAQIQGLYVGPLSEWNTTITPMLQQLPKGYKVKTNSTNWIGSLINLDGPLSTTGPDEV